MFLVFTENVLFIHLTNRDKCLYDVRKKVFRDFPQKNYIFLHTMCLRLRFYLDNNAMYTRLVVQLKKFDNNDFKSILKMLYVILVYDTPFIFKSFSNDTTNLMIILTLVLE